MKKQFLLFVFLCSLSLSSFAQNPTVSVFSEDGHKFWLIIDGKRINEEPQYRVENVEVDQDWIRMKTIFENPKLKPIDKKNVPTREVDSNKPMAASWVITEKKNGKMAIRISSFKIIDSEVKTTTTQTHDDETKTTTTSVTTETNNSGNDNDNEFSMDIEGNDGQNGNVEMKVKIKLPDGSYTTTDTHTETTTTGKVQKTDTKKETHKHFDGNMGCQGPMNASAFTDAKNSISSKSFEDSKMTLAKQIIKNNCMSSKQLKELLELFSFEDSKLEIAKFAYTYVFDRNNFYLVNDAFSFESSVEELNEYIDQ